MSKRPSIFEELKRRQVYRVAVAYTVCCWLLIQIAVQIFRIFEMPTWTSQLAVLLAALGFPVAVIFAWVFDFTPDGIQRTETTDSSGARSMHGSRRVSRKLNTVIIVALVAAVALLGWRLLTDNGINDRPSTTNAPALSATDSRTNAAMAASAATSTTIAVPAKSIAVLPFENLSADKKNDYFVAGMQDLILTKLADIGDLKVISRTSTARYQSHPENVKAIGRELGVAMLLEGSVQKVGNKVLINVQLIDARTDSHIWAKAYPRTLDNIFGVEGEVAEHIAETLKAKLSDMESQRLADKPTENPAAYDLFLHAEYQLTKGGIHYDTARWKAAIPLYRQAVAKDPTFALAFARLSRAESALAWFGGGGKNVKKLVAAARADAKQALALRPDLAAAHLALGFSDYWGRGDYAGALKHFNAALAARPNDAGALAACGYVQRRQGQFDAAMQSFKEALDRDPRNTALAFDLGATAMAMSHYTDAQRWFKRAMALDPANTNAKLYASQTIVFDSGNIAQALIAAQGDAVQLRLQRVDLLTLQRDYPKAQALLQPIAATPDHFSLTNVNGSKALKQANLYRLAGDAARAKPLFEQARTQTEAQSETHRGINLGFIWANLASAELGLGDEDDALAAIGNSREVLARSNDHLYGPELMRFNASLYAQAGLAERAVPLLEKALATPGCGLYYAPVLLWIDPAWDPIRADPRFQALLKRYASAAPVSASTNVASATSSAQR